MIGVRKVAISLLAIGCATPALAGVSAQLVENNLAFSGKPMLVDGFSPNAPVINISGGNTQGNGIVFDAESSLQGNEIFFKNGIIGSGRTTSMLATIGVAVTIDNTFGFDFRPQLRTKILAAGMGLFFATPLVGSTPPAGNTLDAPGLADCSARQLKNCSLADAGALLVSSTAPELFANTNAGFRFDISVGGTSIYNLTSSLGYDANGNYFEDLDDARLLDGFKSTTGSNPDATLSSGYSWQDTFVNILFPEILRAGESVTAVYTISTFMNLGGDNRPQSGSFLTEDGTRLRLALEPGAFAAFGDPIGGNGTIDDLRDGASVALDLATGLTRFNTNGTGVFSLPTIDVDPVTGTAIVLLDGETRFLPRDENPYGPVPEPSVWAMLIMGFGLVGGALRRRTSQPA